MPLVEVHNITRDPQLALLRKCNAAESAGLRIEDASEFRIAQTLARRGLVVIVDTGHRTGYAVAAGYWSDTLKYDFERLVQDG